MIVSPRRGLIAGLRQQLGGFRDLRPHGWGLRQRDHLGVSPAGIAAGKPGLRLIMTTASPRRERNGLRQQFEAVLRWIRCRRRLSGTVIAVVLSVCMAGACTSHPLIPPSVLRSPSPASNTPPRVTGPAVGVDVYVPVSVTIAEAARDGRRAVAYVRSLHATAVGLVWNLDSPAPRSDIVGAGKNTASPAVIATLTREAQAAGMTVQYRPLLRIGPSAAWGGRARPADSAAWFTSLLAAEKPYLEDAARLRVGQFVAGTELHGVNASPVWPSFLARVSAIYPGTVTVAEHQSNYFRQHLVPVDTIGVDPYPNLGLPDTATQAQVTAAWEGLFSGIKAAVRHRTELDEVGFIAEDGAYDAPQKWARRAAVNWAMQTRWFTAACRTVHHYGMTGIWFYELNLLVSPDRVNPFPGFFAQRAGARAIRACARLLG
jgi:hypothetical protein